jgi:site-specific DNA-methyltransferase (adenine-specific)
MQLTPKINIYNSDCLDAMKAMPDNAYDLAIVDPPYGIDDKLYRSSHGGCVRGLTKYAENNWDKETPTNKYFMELIRVSKEQIVWGGNYFPILWNKGCRGLITWDKNGLLNNYEPNSRYSILVFKKINFHNLLK